MRALSPRQRILVVAGGVLLLPVVLVLALQLTNTYRDRQRDVEREALQTAHQIVELADAQAQADLRALRVLATSSTMQRGDWAAARERARSATQLIPSWRLVVLTNVATGAVLFDSSRSRPSGAYTPPPENLPAEGLAEGVQRDGEACPCVRMHVPVANRPELVLTLHSSPVVYQEALLRQLPQGVVAGLVDREGEFLARSIDFVDRVGTPATEYVRAAVRAGGEGFYRGRTFEGFENYTAYATSRLTGWSAHIAVDRSLIDVPRTQSAAALLIGAIIALGVAGAIIGYALYDMAARRREEARLMELQKAEAISEFTSTIVHDFRNLLAIVDASLHLITRHSQEPDTMARASVAREAIERGMRLTNQLLGFARRDGAEVQAVDLNALLTGMSDLLQKAVGEGVELKIDVPADLHVTANRDQLELAFVNLATNARDAMGERGNFEISAQQERDSVVVRVADTGPGVPEKQRDRLFDAFYTTKPAGKGTGLGLAQVAGAVRQAGGSIEVDDAPGGGALFVMRLRAADATAAQAAAEPEQS